MTSWNWLYVNLKIISNNALLAYSGHWALLLCILKDYNLNLWVFCGGCCVDHSLFQIIFVCHLRSRLPLNAKPSVDAVGKYEWSPNEVPTSCALVLRSEPLMSFAEPPPAALCLCAFFSFPFGFSGWNFPKIVLILGLPNLWCGTENPLALRPRAASLSHVLHHFSHMGAKLSDFGSPDFSLTYHGFNV